MGIEKGNEVKDHYIFCFKHTNDHEDVVTWWRPEGCGYTFFLAAAGKYSEKEILKHKCHYINGRDNFVIPCAEVEKLAHPDHNGDLVVDNNKQNKIKLKKLAMK